MSFYTSPALSSMACLLAYTLSCRYQSHITSFIFSHLGSQPTSRTTPSAFRNSSLLSISAMRFSLVPTCTNNYRVPVVLHTSTKTSSANRIAGMYAMLVLKTVQVADLSPRNEISLLHGIFPTLSRRKTAAAEARSSKELMDNLPELMSTRVVGAHVPPTIVPNA